MAAETKAHDGESQSKPNLKAIKHKSSPFWGEWSMMLTADGKNDF